ncbi:MAG: hypothetical protein ACJA0O_001308 [Porticoccus sp.]
MFLKGFQQKQTGNDQWGLHGACDSSTV